MEGTIKEYWGHDLMDWAIQELLGIWNGVNLSKNLGVDDSIKRAWRKGEREAVQGKKAT